MYFKEPKVEFVSVDMEMVIATSPACDGEATKKGSVETCSGLDAPSNACPLDALMMHSDDVTPVPEVPADESITTM